MNNTTKIIISVLGFALCGLIGFFGTRVVRNISVESGKTAEAPAYSASSGAGTVSGDSPAGIENAPLPEPSTKESDDNHPVILSVTAPKQSGDGFTFTVSASGEGLVYHLADKNKTDIGSGQGTPLFNVPATADGIYYVYVTDNKGNKSDYYQVSGCKAAAQVKQVEASELQAIINSGDSEKAIAADFKNRVSSSCSYHCSGISQEEIDLVGAPASYNEMINRVNQGIWRSVTVSSVSYDNGGRLNSANITVNY